MENCKNSNASVTSQLISQLQPISDYWLSQDLTPQSDLIELLSIIKKHRRVFDNTQRWFFRWELSEFISDESFDNCAQMIHQVNNALDNIKIAILIYASVYQKPPLKQFK